MNEKLRVLEMLDQDTITVEEANQLLEAAQGDTTQTVELNAAAALLKSVKHDLGKPGTDPIVVDIDDADDRVQIHIG